MEAMIIETFGRADIFKAARSEKPPVGDHQVLIQVEASSVNPLDIKIRNGSSPALAPELPAILHGDVAGTITQVGKDVSHLKVGDEVYGWAGGMNLLPSGALAEYMLAPADMIAQKPRSLSMAEAAALPLISLTAYQALIELAQIHPGHKVLIHGGTGGVGHIALQIANIKGATTYVTCSSEHKMGLALECGADFAINYKQHEVNDYVMRYTDERGFDIVFDTVGKDNFEKSLQAVALGGQVVSTLLKEPHDLSGLLVKGLSLHAVNVIWPILANKHPLPFATWLKTIADWVDNKQLAPLIDSEQFTFHQVGAAHEYVEKNKNTGKVVLIQSLN